MERHEFFDEWKEIYMRMKRNNYWLDMIKKCMPIILFLIAGGVYYAIYYDLHVFILLGVFLCWMVFVCWMVLKVRRDVSNNHEKFQACFNQTKSEAFEKMSNDDINNHYSEFMERYNREQSTTSFERETEQEFDLMISRN